MTAPIWIMMTLLGINVAVAVLHHGKPMGFYNGWAAMIDAAMMMGLLYWAGLFDG